jgi:hypothetical protein
MHGIEASFILHNRQFIQLNMDMQDFYTNEYLIEKQFLGKCLTRIHLCLPVR